MYYLPSAPRFFALDVANAFLETQDDSDPSHTKLVQESAFLVGAHVAERGCEGDWSQLDAESFFHGISYLDERDLIGVSIALIGLFGWLGGSSDLPPELCATVIRDIGDYCPKVDFLQELVDSALRLLSASSSGQVAMLLN